ncbi:MAG: alpha/beta hydrolase [Desulfobacteraceae bacterium]|nr:MAG: alpha/beta hydrolase [Desulfobacteraceae bacterium]
MSKNEMVLRSIDAGEVSIQYLDSENDAPAIVFLHATGFLPWLWQPIAREFSDTYRVIAPYFCDYREADPHKGGLSWASLAMDLVGFCKALDIQNPYLVGHSMGGAVIAIAAGALGLKVQKTVLIEPIFLPQEIYSMDMTVDQHPLASKSIRRRNAWADAEEAKAYLKSKKLFRVWDDEMLDLYVRYGMVPSQNGGLELTCHPQREAALFMGSRGYDPWPVLSKVASPVLVLEGEHTENKGFIDQQKAAAMFPSGEYRLIEGAGHLIPMERPRETVRVIREFFER